MAATALAVGALGPDLVAPSISMFAAGARRVFPLGLGEQTIELAGLQREPIQILLRIMLADVDDRTRATSPALIGGLVCAAPKGAAGVPFIEGYLEPRYRKGPGDGDFVLRRLGILEKNPWASAYVRRRW